MCILIKVSSLFVRASLRSVVKSLLLSKLNVGAISIYRDNFFYIYIEEIIPILFENKLRKIRIYKKLTKVYIKQ